MTIYTAFAIKPADSGFGMWQRGEKPIGPQTSYALLSDLIRDGEMIDLDDALADKDFIEAGADWVTVHVETCVHLHRTLACIKDLGRKAGAVLNPATSLATLDYVLAEVDLVMLMSVNPGFGGQSFIPSAIDKIRRLRQMLDAVNPAAGIEVDGGIGPATIEAVAEAGANIFVAGSAIYGQTDYAAVIRELKERASR